MPILDDDEDTRITEEDLLDGKIIRMEPTIVETWKMYFSEGEDMHSKDNDGMDIDGQDEPFSTSNRWRPFASELDWRVAMWVIREDVGQNSMNRFLSIPGVRALPVKYCTCLMII